MVKTVGLLLLISAAAFAQRGGIRPGPVRSGPIARPGTFGSNTGFGNVVFPGTGQAPALPGAITDTTFGPRLGATVSGYPPYTGGRGRGVGGGVVVLPYPVAMPYYPEPEPQAPQTIVVYPQQQQVPQVVINQNFTPETARPVVHEYVVDSNGGVRVYDPRTRVNPEPQPPEIAAAPPAENPVYLIAFKDNTVYAALAYWVEGETLHYVTNRNTHNQVSLDLIDRELSMRLNSEREVEFRLPPARR